MPYYQQTWWALAVAPNADANNISHPVFKAVVTVFWRPHKQVSNKPQQWLKGNDNDKVTNVYHCDVHHGEFQP